MEHLSRKEKTASPADVSEAIWKRVDALMEAMEANQREKVIALARRLLPGLTLEDIRNPHDFPELSDPDWHFEDGQLTGIQSARFALRALSGEVLAHGEQGAARAAKVEEVPDKAELRRKSGEQKDGR